MKSAMGLLVVVALMASCAPNIHSPYYSNPTGGGYNTQVIGIKCHTCGRIGQISWNQYNTRETVTCPYCGALIKVKEGVSAHTYDIRQQNNEGMNQAVINLSETYQKQQAEKKQSLNSSSSPSSCEYKTYTVFTNGKTMFCTQYSSCDVQCY